MRESPLASEKRRRLKLGGPCAHVSLPGLALINRQRFFFALLAALLVATLCVVVALLLLRARERAIDELRRDTRNLTTALALYTGSIVTSIDLALVGTRDSLALLELAQHAPAHADQGNQLLRASVTRIGLPVLMRVLDIDGNQVLVSEGPPTAVSSRDRDYFQAHLTRDAGLLISQPFVSRINGKAAIVFSRRIEGADGRFKGVILIGTPMDLFEELFQRFEVGSRGTLILADDAGTLLARRPAATNLVGKKVLRDDGVLSLLRSGTNAGVRINDAPWTAFSACSASNAWERHVWWRVSDRAWTNGSPTGAAMRPSRAR
jgi:two-component system, NarL family, sensor histidine kinase BarA